MSDAARNCPETPTKRAAANAIKHILNCITASECVWDQRLPNSLVKQRPTILAHPFDFNDVKKKQRSAIEPGCICSVSCRLGQAKGGWGGSPKCKPAERFAAASHPGATQARGRPDPSHSQFQRFICSRACLGHDKASWTDTASSRELASFRTFSAFLGRSSIALLPLHRRVEVARLGVGRRQSVQEGGDLPLSQFARESPTDGLRPIAKRRLRARGPEPGAGVIGRGELGAEPDHLGIVGQCFVELLLGLPDGSPVVVRRDEFGVEPDRLVEVGEGLVEFLPGEPDQAPIVVRRGEFGVEPDRLIVVGEGLVEFLPCLPGQPRS